jgi:hypothetical protein
MLQAVNEVTMGAHMIKPLDMKWIASTELLGFYNTLMLVFKSKEVI